MKKIILLIMTLLWCTSIIASPVKELIFFGDSLSDDGNLLRILKIVPKSPPYYKGRFSNGITWAEHVSDHFYNKSYIQYANYCYGGATTILHKLRSNKFISPMNLEVELDSYFLHSPFKNKAQSAYVVWIGANDYLYETTPDIDGLTTQVVNKISDSTERLLKAGGHGVLIINLPDLSMTPYARDHQMETRLYDISRMHNLKLDVAIKKLNAKYNNKIMFMDIYTIFSDLLKHPDEYNKKYNTHITNTINGCWSGTVFGLNNTIDNNMLEQELRDANITSTSSTTILLSPALRQAYLLGQNAAKGGIPCDNADEHLFWDDLHPSAVVHKVLGQIMIETLEKNHWLS